MKEQLAKENFMREAIRLSIENVESGKGGPFAAVIVKDGKILATGVNQVILTNDPTAHAEVVAIRNACKTLNSFQLDGCEIYCSCEPCRRRATRSGNAVRMLSSSASSRSAAGPAMRAPDPPS